MRRSIAVVWFLVSCTAAVIAFVAAFRMPHPTRTLPVLAAPVIPIEQKTSTTSVVLLVHDPLVEKPVEPIPTVPVTTTTPPLPKEPTPSGKPPQMVVLAFDGSRSLNMWEKTRAFAKEMSDAGKPVHFTYFISGVYFLSDQHRMLYQAPHQKAGESLIGFADNNADVMNRVKEVNAALSEGHEIGSHVNGHYTGVNWTEADWRQEFTSFNNLMFHIPENNRMDPAEYAKNPLLLTQSDVIGFRAPELGMSAGLWPVLKEFGFTYDTSRVGKPDMWPAKSTDGLWSFPLGSIPFATSTNKIISMDYNFYFKQSGAKDVAKKGTSQWQLFHDQMLTSYEGYFQKNYDGDRAPIYIGHHFSEWNDGAYWEAMKDFARETCGKPEVKCVTFSEVEKYMEKR